MSLHSARQKFWNSSAPAPARMKKTWPQTSLHSAIQKFHANQASSKKFATPEIRTQLNTLIPPLASQLGWFTFSDKEQPQPYLLGAEMEN